MKAPCGGVHPPEQAVFSAGNFTPSNGAGVVFRLVPNW